MKETLEKLIQSKSNEERFIREKIKASNDEAEVRSLGDDLAEVLEGLNKAKADLEKLVAENPVESPVEEPRAEDEAPKEEPKETPNETPKEEVPAEEPKEEPKKEEERNWVKVGNTDMRKKASFEMNKEERKMEETRKVEMEQIEKRAKDLLEGRAVTVASSDILLPKHQSSNLATAPFRQVSSFIDLTAVKNFNGGESYEVPFVKEYGTGGIVGEGEEYTEAEPTFGNAKINKVKITAYAEFSEEVEKLPAANYEPEIRKGVEVALKKVIAAQQIGGAGTANTFVGIKSVVADNTAVLVNDDLPLTEINADTLNQIIFKYGGDEEVEQKGVLVLNKADLLAFSLVKNEIGEHAYKIDLANQTINTVPYVINSNCAALSAEGTAEGAYTMFYGVPSHYTTAIFSPVEIKKSYDYKFREGKVCYKAVVFAGGNTTSYRGFIRVKKAAKVSA